MSPLNVVNDHVMPRIDPGSYTLELVGVRKKQVKDYDDSTQLVDRIALTFAIRDDVTWEGTEFTDLCTESFGARSKLGQILVALNGGDPLPTGEFDLEAFLGRKMRAMVKRNEKGYNRVDPETAVPLSSQADSVA